MTFKEFYPIYLSMHSHKTTKMLHSIGLYLGYMFALLAILRKQYWFLTMLPMTGYWFAFSSHFFIEHNTPASFKHPLLSLLCDHLIAFNLLLGRE